MLWATFGMTVERVMKNELPEDVLPFAPLYYSARGIILVLFFFFLGVC